MSIYMRSLIGRSFVSNMSQLSWTKSMLDNFGCSRTKDISNDFSHLAGYVEITVKLKTTSWLAIDEPFSIEIFLF